MRTTNEWLDHAKKRLKCESDYKLAQRLNISRATISQYRATDRVMSQRVAAKLAAALGIDPRAIIVDTAIERAETLEVIEERPNRRE